MFAGDCIFYEWYLKWLVKKLINNDPCSIDSMVDKTVNFNV